MDLSGPSLIQVDKPSQDSILGITVAQNGDLCVTTSSSVSMFDVNDEMMNSPIASWTPPNVMKNGFFTHACVSDNLESEILEFRSESSIWAIQGGNQLLMWKMKDLKLNKLKKAQLHSAVSSMFVTTVYSKENMDQIQEIVSKPNHQKQSHSENKTEDLSIKIPIIVIIHTNGDISTFHASSLTLLASWTSVLNTNETITSSNDGCQLPVWCQVFSDHYFNHHESLKNDNNESSSSTPLNKLSRTAQELLQIELKDDLTYSQSSSTSTATSTSFGGATIFVLQKKSLESDDLVMNVFNLNSLLQSSSSSSTLMSSSPVSRLSLDRTAVHHFIPPQQSSPNGKVSSNLGKTWNVQGSFSSPTFSLLWQSEKGLAILQSYQFIMTNQQTCFIKHPLLSFERIVSCQHNIDLSSSSSSSSETSSSLSYVLSSLDKSHVSLLCYDNDKEEKKKNEMSSMISKKNSNSNQKKNTKSLKNDEIEDLKKNNMSIVVIDIKYGTIITETQFLNKNKFMTNANLVTTATQYPSLYIADIQQENSNIVMVGNQQNSLTISSLKHQKYILGKLVIYSNEENHDLLDLNLESLTTSKKLKKKLKKKDNEIKNDEKDDDNNIMVNDCEVYQYTLISNERFQEVQPFGSLAYSLGQSNQSSRAWSLSNITTSSNITSICSVPLSNHYPYLQQCFKFNDNEETTKKKDKDYHSCGHFGPNKIEWENHIFKKNLNIQNEMINLINNLILNSSSHEKKKYNLLFKQFENIYLKCIHNFSINNIDKKKVNKNLFLEKKRKLYEELEENKNDKNEENDEEDDLKHKKINFKKMGIFALTSIHRYSAICQMNQQMLIGLLQCCVMLSNHFISKNDISSSSSSSSLVQLYYIIELCMSDLIGSNRISARQYLPIIFSIETQQWIKINTSSSSSQGTRLMPLLVQLGNWRLVEKAMLQLPDLPEVDSVMILREVLIGLNDDEITDTLHLYHDISPSLKKMNHNSSNDSSSSKKQKLSSSTSKKKKNVNTNSSNLSLKSRIKIVERILCCSMIRGEVNEIMETKSFLYVTRSAKPMTQHHQPTSSSSQLSTCSNSSSFLRNASIDFTTKECITILLILLNLIKKNQKGENYLSLYHINKVRKEYIYQMNSQKKTSIDFLLPLPDLEKIADWVSAIIDSHFAHLAFQGMTENNELYVHCLQSLMDIMNTSIGQIEMLSETKMRASEIMLSSYRKTELALNRMNGQADEGGTSSISDYSLEDLCV